mgnify:FL=1
MKWLIEGRSISNPRCLYVIGVYEGKTLKEAIENCKRIERKKDPWMMKELTFEGYKYVVEES